MNKAVVSIDLWGTVFDFSTDLTVSEYRRKLVRKYAEQHGVTDASLVDEAYVGAAHYFFSRYENEAVTLSARERLAYQLEQLGIGADGDEFERLLESVQNATLEFPPRLAPNLRDGLEVLSKRFTLVMVSDTAFSPGRVIREVLGRCGIASYFADYSFSDENGTSKPHAYAFMSVLERVGGAPSKFMHIGDTEWSDIKGAQMLGASACLYVGLNDRWLHGTSADYILRDWRDVPGLLDQIERSKSGVV